MNDKLDDLFAGATSEVRQASKPDFKPAEVRAYTENCPKCGGSGRFGRNAICFKCKGSGKLTFKTSYADRAKATTQRTDRKARRAEEIATSARDALQASHPAVLAWLDRRAAGGNNFAASLLGKLAQFGSLTDGQIGAVEKIVAQDAERDAAKAKAVADAPAADTAGIDRLKAAFDKAVAYSAAKGLKLSPKINVAGLVISPAKADSKNPGALYVKEGRNYLGKIAGGKFHALRICSQQQTDKVLAFVADPAEAAKVYGQTTGTCCVCNATLRSEWKHKGIGPICAEKFGW